MKHLKLFEEFENNQSIVATINNLINNETVINKVQQSLDSLPFKMKNIIVNFVKQKRIDMNYLLKVERRYNIVRKVKDLLNKGVRNFKDIMDRILPKNEGLVELWTILIVIGFLVWFLLVSIVGVVKLASIDEDKNLGPFITIPLAIVWVAVVAFSGAYGADYLYKKVIPAETELDNRVEEVADMVQDWGIKADTIVLIRQPDGKYTIEIKNQDDTLKNSDW